MEITAAVTQTKGAPFVIEQVTLDRPREEEVLVRIVASGICHTDISMRDQFKPLPLPAVLGHEGAGVVEEVGPGVRSVRPGDHVVLSYTSCGECLRCQTGQPYMCDHYYSLNFGGKLPDGSHRLHAHGQSLSTFFGQSSFASHATVPERSIVRVGSTAPLEIVAPLGCGIQAGSGTVLNRLRPKVGSSIAVFGCGTVGLSAIMAAKSSGCGVIIGVDVHQERIDLARELGATHGVDGSTGTTVDTIREITGNRLQYSIDTTARPGIFRQAIEALAVGGVSVLLGGAPLGTDVRVDMNHLLYERTVLGVTSGDSVPSEFIPKLIDLYATGKFPIDRLIKQYRLQDINEAVSDMESGRVIKPVIVL